jgi:hypothetical protein
MVEITRDCFTKSQIIHHLAEIAREVHNNGVSTLHGTTHHDRLEDVHEVSIRIIKDSPGKALSPEELDKLRR